MRHVTLLGASLGALILSGQSLSTDYGRQRTLRIEAETAVGLETTSFEMLVDGEPVDRPFGGGGVEEQRHVVLLDGYEESADGEPTRVRRTFETVESESRASFGENERTQSSQGPLAGVVLRLTRDEDGDVEAEVVEGDEPDAALLEGQVLTLCLDALLPAGEVEEDESWDLDADTVRRALALALDPKLFPPPAENAPVEAGERRGGGRGGFGGRGGGSAFRLLQDAEWEGTATLEATDEDHEGEACSAIAIEIEASGDMPEPRGGRRGGFSVEPAESAPAVDSTFTVEITGRLLFANEARRPVLLELSGELSTERENEFERGDRTMTMHVTQEGTFTHTVLVSEE